MKRITSAVAGFAVLITLTACGDEQPQTEGTNESAAPVTLHLLSHTYASLEYYAGQLEAKAPEGVTVEAEMTNYSDWQEKMRLNLASGSDSYDITYITPQDVAEFAANGWLEPLDDFVEKYRDEYDFDDIPEYLWEAYSYEGHIYGIPSHQWAMILFYRTDLFDESGLDVPETLGQLVDTAKSMTADGRSGITLTLAAADMLMVTYQSFLTATGGWFWDDAYKPQFSSEASLTAIDYIMDLYEYTPADSSTYTNNEAVVAMGQDLATMALLQTTRSSAMDDPEQSIVVGKVGFASAPSLTVGGPSAAIWNTAGYSIPKDSAQDKELIFRTIANATDKQSSAGGVESSMPCRESVLTEDLLDGRSDYAAAWKAIQSGATLRPTIPEFGEIMEISMTALSSVITGQAEARTAMEQVDKEVEAVLKDAGYYN
ncbi:MAG: extracellular solute-binding protein [Bifidobacteriaceae bacterium]|jgi:ABC-type glycerol-3-phosphate transport system substrate-binding protein|nr:extracellular solute-binding protein [Bifidobacteriaceae bacterium]